MSKVRLLSRRHFAAGAAASVLSPALPWPGVGMPAAQPSDLQAQIANAATNHWGELGSLSAEAARLGFSVPRLSARLDSDPSRDYLQLMPATIDLIDSIATGVPAKGVSEDEVERLARKSHALLRRIHQIERSPPTDRRGDDSLSATVSSRPGFDALREEYDKLFASCTIRDKNRSDVAWHVNKLGDERAQKQWLQVAQNVCCPWYFVAIIHSMEAGFDFRAHLHNGDPLSERTVQVPAKRPPQWNPPSDWVSSATDALTYDGFADQADWSIARTLYRWESYNGFRSRKNGINTPYLWSFSNHYARGKFVADGVWDPNAVSKQCGAAVMLKALLDKGLVTPPAS